MILRTFIFLLLNFAALGIGSLFTGPGVSSDWYQNFDKAPWTPPGWFFGVAWSTIMIFFSIYMARLWQNFNEKKIIITLYLLQWVLNVSWNPVFFYLQAVSLGLLVIVSLTLLVGHITLRFKASSGYFTLLIIPYLLWLIVASSLNAYILIAN